MMDSLDFSYISLQFLNFFMSVSSLSQIVRNVFIALSQTQVTKCFKQGSKLK